MEVFIISILSLVLAFNVGANNAASSMSTVFGAKIMSKLGTVSLAFIFVLSCVNFILNKMRNNYVN